MTFSNGLEFNFYKKKDASLGVMAPTKYNRDRDNKNNWAYNSII